MPLSNSCDAPRFASNPFSFDAFFEDVSELAMRAGLSAADTIKWALRYAGAEADSWQHVPCLASGNNVTFTQFKQEVLQVYPHLAGDRRHTKRDLEQLIERTQGFRDMTRDDLGEYYRKFITYTAYLIVRESPPPTPREAYLPQRLERTQEREASEIRLTYPLAGRETRKTKQRPKATELTHTGGRGGVTQGVN